MALVERSLSHPHFSSMPYNYSNTLSALTLTVPQTPLSPSIPSTPHPHPLHFPSALLSEILPRLYISDVCAAEDPVRLAEFGITHVLSTMPGTVRIPPGLRGAQVALQDTPFEELAEHLPHTSQWIHDALRDPKARVLVHCALGSSRSVSVVCAYLIAHHGFTPGQAVEYIKERRWVANPNRGFVDQLHEYWRSLRDHNA
ncbi:phosphatases II [Auriscalpium vulgare]|uniref:Phosphatases II n=1 Tax=Auriscalpium vulgare TaxID=40419 RepID=A0ACB8R692_9AGAM|nr:phosphatases II [Auriscalpium vulgare]